MRYLKGFVWAVLFLAGTVKCQPQAPAPTTANQADAVAERIAKGHFPEELRDPADPDNTGDCTVVYDNTPDGAPATIFAVYPEAMHGVAGEMWVFLKGAGDQYTALPVTPANFDFDAANCAITTIDGGPARRHEHIMVSLGGEKSSREFIFSWDGHQLTSIGPTVRSGNSVVAGLTEAQVVHLYQGGSPAVLSEEAGTNEDSDEDETAIYRFDGRRYVREGLAIATEMIDCGPRSCAGQSPTGTFKVEASQGPYVLRVGNGDSRGQNRVSGIRIAINEVDVVRDRDLTATTDALAVPLSKLRVGTNKISVQVEPRADHGAGKIAVLIEDLGPGR